MLHGVYEEKAIRTALKLYEYDYCVEYLRKIFCYMELNSSGHKAIIKFYFLMKKIKKKNLFIVC